MYMYILNVNIYVSTNDYLFKYIYLVRYVKFLLLLPHLFCNVEFEFSEVYNTKQSSEILILKIEMLVEFQNEMKTIIIG